MSRVKKGFTLIELSLSMAFIALLSLIMVVIIMNAVSSYRRGLTLDLINTTGMDLVEEFRTAVQGSPARSLKEECSELYSSSGPLRDCRADNGKSLAVVTRYGYAVNLDTEEELDEIPIYGAVCTGKYTYVWNSGYFMSDKYGVYVGSEERLAGMQIKYLNDSGEEETTTGLEKLIKFDDEDRTICRAVAGYRAGTGVEGIDTGYKEGIYRKFTQIKIGDRNSDIDGANIDKEVDVTSIMYSGTPEELLKNDKYNNLALYDLTTAVPAKASMLNDMFYSMSFILGTLQGGADVKVAGGNCKPPENMHSEFDYCAINKFNFAAQANGG